MIKFLIQHSSTLEEKDGSPIEEDTRVDFGHGEGAENDHLERSRVTQGFMRDIQGAE